MDDEPEYPRDHGHPFDKANGLSSQVSSSIEGGRQRRRKGQAAPPDPRSPQAQITGPPRDGDRRRNGGPDRDHNDAGGGGVNSPIDEHSENPRRNTSGNRYGGWYSRQPTWGQPQGFMYGYPNSYGLMPPHMPPGPSPYPPMNYHSYMAPLPPPPPPPAATAPAATPAPAAARTTEVGTSKGKNLDDEVQQLKEGYARFIHEQQAEKETAMRREIEAGVAREFEEQARRLIEEQASVRKELEIETQKARSEAEAAARERLEASERQKRDWEKQVEEFAKHAKHEMEKIQRQREKSQRDMERREAERLANEEKRTAEVVAAAQSVEEERLQLARETTSAKEELFELQIKIREDIRAEEAERRAVFEERLLREVKEANASSAVTGESIKRKVEQLQQALNEGKSAVRDALKLADEAKQAAELTQKLAEDARKTAEWATQCSKLPETPPPFVQYQEVDPVLQAPEAHEPAEQPPLFSEEHVEDRGGAGSNTEDNDDDVSESSSSGSEQLVDYDREAKEACVLLKQTLYDAMFDALMDTRAMHDVQAQVPPRFWQKPPARRRRRHSLTSSEGESEGSDRQPSMRQKTRHKRTSRSNLHKKQTVKLSDDQDQGPETVQRDAELEGSKTDIHESAKPEASDATLIRESDPSQQEKSDDTPDSLTGTVDESAAPGCEATNENNEETNHIDKDTILAESYDASTVTREQSDTKDDDPDEDAYLSDESNQSFMTACPGDTEMKPQESEARKPGLDASATHAPVFSNASQSNIFPTPLFQNGGLSFVTTDCAGAKASKKQKPQDTHTQLLPSMPFLQQIAIAPYFHLPLQSYSDGLIKRRKYSVSDSDEDSEAEPESTSSCISSDDIYDD